MRTFSMFNNSCRHFQSHENDCLWLADNKDRDLTLFMNDTTLSEVINVRDNIPSTSIGRSLYSAKKVLDFASFQ